MVEAAGIAVARPRSEAERPISGVSARSARQPTSIPDAETSTQARSACVGGGGGNRTRVRKGSYGSFYTLRRLAFLSRLDPAERQMGSRPARASRPSATGVASGPSRLVVASLSRFGRTAQETPQLKLRKPACCRWLFYFHRFNEVSGPRRATSASAFPSNPVRPHTGGTRKGLTARPAAVKHERRLRGPPDCHERMAPPGWIPAASGVRPPPDPRYARINDRSALRRRRHPADSKENQDP